jgi:hypothetical protein
VLRKELSCVVCVVGLKEGTLDEAVKGLDVIAHNLSPYHMKADNPQGKSLLSCTLDYLYSRQYTDTTIPAVKTTVWVLQNGLIMKNRCIAITSSIHFLICGTLHSLSAKCIIITSFCPDILFSCRYLGYALLFLFLFPLAS